MGFMNLLKFSAACFDLILGWPLFAVGYPLCASIWVILTYSISDIGKLVTYWVLFSLISLFDDAFADFLKWIPFWPCIKLMVICWLVIPHFDGSYYVYQHLFHPCLSMDPQVAISMECEELTVAQKEIQAVEVTEIKNGDRAKRVQQTEIKLGETKSNTTCAAEIKERAAALVAAEIEACRDDRTCEIPLHKKVQKECASVVSQVTTQSEATLNSHLQEKIHQATSEQLKAKSQATKTNGSPSASMAKKSDQSTNEEQLKCTSNNLNSKNNGISAASTVKKPDETKDGEQGHQKNLKQTGDGMKELGLWCNICDVSCTSELDMASHLNGRRHFNMIKQPSELWCSNCNVKCNSETDMASHQSGSRHLEQLKERSGLWCSVCSVSCNSQVDMDSHLNGRRHQDQFKEQLLLSPKWEEQLKCTSNNLNSKNNGISAALTVKKPDETKDDEQGHQKNIKQTGDEMKELGLWCIICNVSCTSVLGLASHRNGRKHFKRIKQLSKLWCSNCNVKCDSEADMASHRNGSRHLEQLKERSGLWCSICSVSCNSEVAMDSHLNGRRHLNQINETVKIMVWGMCNGIGNSEVSMASRLNGWCNICNVSCTSELDLASHLNGRKHFKRIKQLSKLWCSNCNVKCNSEADIASHRNGSSHLEQLKERSGLWCSICCVSCNSQVDMDSHLNGRRHQDQIKEQLRLWCGACNVICNSEVSMASHLNGRRHLEKKRNI